MGSDLEEAAATVAGDSDGARRWERVNQEEAAVGALWAGGMLKFMNIEKPTPHVLNDTSLSSTFS